MSLSLWNTVDPFFGSDPFDDMQRVMRRMDRFLNHLTTGTGQGSALSTAGNRSAAWMPVLDVKESDKQYTVHAELPGIKKEDINIDFDKGILTISGEKKDEKKEENEKWHRVERSYGKFSRSLVVPEGVTPEQIKAKFDNGVLEVTFPKPEIEQKKEELKKITIS